ncbi:MAG: pyridoxal phosphate-dependent aminotransferase [Planctomycetota bacterium]
MTRLQPIAICSTRIVMDIPTFDYMRFAKTSSAGARISLTMSGLGPPPADWLGDPARLVDLHDSGTEGTLFLREKIADRYGVHPDEVFVTPGASAAIHIISGILTIPGHRALIERPYYAPLGSEPQAFGSVLGFIDRRLEENYRWNPSRVKESLALAPRASMLFFTNLHNPTGVLASETDILETGEAAAATGTRLVCCELYADFLGPARPKPVATIIPGAVSIGSMTKAFGFGSIRVGWIICKDKEVLKRADHYFDHLDVNCSMPSMRIAAAALDHIDIFERRAAEISKAGKAVFFAWANREVAKNRIRVVEPAGGIIAFPLLYGVPDTFAFAKRVRERHGVQITPGEYFQSPGHVRLGFGLEPAILKEALDAISAELPVP